MKNIGLFCVIVSIIHSCNLDDNKQSDVVTKETDCTNILENKQGDDFFIELDHFLKTLTSCSEVDIYYKELTKEEDDELLLGFSNHINHYSTAFSDSSVLAHDFMKLNLGNYNTPCQYNQGACKFYTEYIYCSKNKDIQYIKLFQKGEAERFDLLLKKTKDGEFKVLAVG